MRQERASREQTSWVARDKAIERNEQAQQAIQAGLFVPDRHVSDDSPRREDILGFEKEAERAARIKRYADVEFRRAAQAEQVDRAKWAAYSSSLQKQPGHSEHCLWLEQAEQIALHTERRRLAERVLRAQQAAEARRAEQASLAERARQAMQAKQAELVERRAARAATRASQRELAEQWLREALLSKVARLLPASSREDFIGDLEEYYADACTKCDPRLALRQLISQARASFFHLLWARAGHWVTDLVRKLAG